MKVSFFETVKHLFPRARAFDLVADTAKRRLMEGLAELPEDIRNSAELVYGDIFPKTTRFPDKWEKTFALYLSEAEFAKRRDILEALWKIISGDQGTNFIEDVLHAIDPGFIVVESVPVVYPRNKNVVYMCVCGYEGMVCGHETAVCGYRKGEDNYVPDILQNDTSELYSIPDDQLFWEPCFFICKSVMRGSSGEIIFVEPIEINRVWKNIIEYLILKIKPVHTTAVLFIKWITEETSDTN